MQVMSTARAKRAATARAGKNRIKGMGHPTTAAIDYTADDMEFMDAIQAWQLRTGRRFPTWREVLSVVRSLGYKQV